MKKIIISIAIIFSFIIASAQSSSEHLTFKGIPIDGPLKVFISKLKKSGFTYLSSDSKLALLEGKFAGIPNCIIGVHTQENHDNVDGIIVRFPQKDEWSTLESEYLTIKKMLTEKYGTPAECTEEFQSYSSPRDNFDKFLKLKLDQCCYKTTFVTAKGYITLALSSDCSVNLLYMDKFAMNTNYNNAVNDL